MGKVTQLVSEGNVKKALAIDNFRNLSKDKIMEFVSLIPHMDKDVAISIINQFPEYSKMAIEMISQLKAVSDEIIKENSDSQKETIAAYRKILDDLGELLKKDDISSEERSHITEKMIEIADKISAKDTENKDWLRSLLQNSSYILGGALLLGAVILGVNVKGHNIPTLKK